MSNTPDEKPLTKTFNDPNCRCFNRGEYLYTYECSIHGEADSEALPNSGGSRDEAEPLPPQPIETDSVEAIVDQIIDEYERLGYTAAKANGLPKLAQREATAVQGFANNLKTAFLDQEYKPFGGELTLIDQTLNNTLATNKEGDK